MVKLPLSKHTSVLLDICHHHVDSRLFSEAFSKLSWNLTMEPFKLSGRHFGRQDDSPTVVGKPWNDSKLQRLPEWFYWTGGTIQDITIDKYRAGMAAPPNLSSRKCYSMADCLNISKSVLESRNRCVSQFYSDYPQAWPSTGVHPRMAWIGQPWKLMVPVVTDVGQDWPTSATDGAAYLAHGREFCENF